MSKKTKKQDLLISLNVPDEKLLKHIANAYGLVCKYRQANKVPHENMDTWALRLVVEGCNALYKFHDEQVKKQLEAKETK
jgi:hypothetical protein